MKEPSALLAETRSEVVFRYVKLMVRSTGASIEDYSVDVVRHWRDRTPAAARHGDFHIAGSVFEQMKSNGQKIRRWMNPEVSARPSVDVEEALVLGLPEPFRSDCLRELAVRCGGLFVALNTTATPLLGDMAELLTQSGEALAALGPLFADGRIDSSDDTQALLKARRELQDVQSVIAGITSRIDQALEGTATRAK